MLNKRYYICGKSKFLLLPVLVFVFYVELWNHINPVFVFLGFLFLLEYIYMFFGYFLITEEALYTKFLGIPIRKRDYKEYTFEGSGKQYHSYSIREHNYGAYYAIIATRKRDGMKKELRFHTSNVENCKEACELLVVVSQDKKTYIEKLVNVLHMATIKRILDEKG